VFYYFMFFFSPCLSNSFTSCLAHDNFSSIYDANPQLLLYALGTGRHYYRVCVKTSDRADAACPPVKVTAILYGDKGASPEMQ
jgi:hypothetical protein